MKVRSGIVLLILVFSGGYLYRHQTETISNQTIRQEAQTILTQAKETTSLLKRKIATLLNQGDSHAVDQKSPVDRVASASSDSTALRSSENNQQADRSSNSSSSTTEMTPIEAIVQDQPLAKQYTYSFTAETPNTVRQVFLAAVAAYNQTGIVQLTAGDQTENNNHIQFSVYQKQTANPGTLELGEGGPKITKKYNLFKSQTTNHATASINTTYQAAIAKSVAMHELGHALGLDHSEQTDSVMYPIDQGVVTLATADLNALRTIYS